MTSLIVKNQNMLKTPRKSTSLDEVENLIDRFFNSYQRYAGEEGMVNMPIELIERDNNFIMKVMIPGMEKEDINIEVSEDQVNILGECKADYEEEKDLIHRSEFCIGRFSRTLSLPEKIDHQSVKAEYRNGILTLILQKANNDIKKKTKVKL